MDPRARPTSTQIRAIELEKGLFACHGIRPENPSSMRNFDRRMCVTLSVAPRKDSRMVPTMIFDRQPVLGVGKLIYCVSILI